jgi:predicted MFS family arabinose efflux permease
MLWPVWLICVASLGVGIAIEMMMVQWNVVMARYIPADKLARVSAYDVLGSVMSMPIGALLAGPIASAIGVSNTQYAAAAMILATSGLTLLSRDIRTRHADDTPMAVAIADAVVPTEPSPALPSAPGVVPATAISSDA